MATTTTNWVRRAVNLAKVRCVPPTKQALANHLGVDRQTIILWERRGSMCGARAETALRMASISGVPIERLVAS